MLLKEIESWLKDENEFDETVDIQQVDTKALRLIYSATEIFKKMV
jgi:hypothetical protein